VGQYEEDEKDDEVRRVLPRKGRQASSREAEVRESDKLWPSGLMQAAGSVPVCGKSESEDTAPISESPPRYEESSTAESNGAQRTTTLRETQVETTRLFGILVLKTTLCSTRSKCEPGSHGWADPTLGVDYAEVTDGRRST
jgi:hypothetical protein